MAEKEKKNWAKKEEEENTGGQSLVRICLAEPSANVGQPLMYRPTQAALLDICFPSANYFVDLSSFPFN